MANKIHRRKFLTNLTAGISALMLTPGAIYPAAKSSKIIRPNALKAGDTVGVITPCSPKFEPDSLNGIKPTFQHFGLKAKIGKHVGKRTASFQQDIAARLDDLHAMFADTEVKAIFASGGYGASQILDKIDYDLIKKNPKIFIGFSDVTALHLAIHKFTGLVTFHGPTPYSTFNEFTQASFNKAVFSSEPIGKLTNSDPENTFRPAYRIRTVFPGTVTGRLVGGNLSLIAATMGTPYEIETEDKILFLEDVAEANYRVDRMLTQLHLAKKFDKVRGIIWGECRRCDDDLDTSIYTLGETIDNILRPLEIPVISGMTIGHTADKLTLPLGVQATLNADEGSLTITESAVV